VLLIRSMFPDSEARDSKLKALKHLDKKWDAFSLIWFAKLA
jgi:hypothetical protein